MTTRRTWVTILALAVVVLAAQPAAAGTVMNAKSFFCGGTGPETASVNVTERNGVLTFRFTGQDLTPMEAVTCGYRCGEFGDDVTGACGTTGPGGRWSGKIQLVPTQLCWGLVPVFLTGSHGACMPSVFP